MNIFAKKKIEFGQEVQMSLSILSPGGQNVQQNPLSNFGLALWGTPKHNYF